MPVYDLQSTFAGGEISPDLYGRVDIAKYKTSAKTLRNFIPSPHGSISNRPGTYYVASTKNGSKKSRMIEFIFSTTQAYALEFGENYIRFYRDGAQILSIGVPVEVTTTYAEADIPDIKFVQSADTLYLVHPSYHPKTLQRTSDTVWVFSNYDFKNGPMMLPNSVTGLSMKLTMPGTDLILTSGIFSPYAPPILANFFNAGHVGAWFLLNIPYPAGSEIHDVTGASTYTLTCGSTWRLITTGTWTGTITVKQYDPLRNAYNVIETFVSNNDANINTFGNVDLLDGYIPVVIQVVTNISSGTAHLNFSTDSFLANYYVQAVTFVNTSQVYLTYDVRYPAPRLGDVIDDWSEGSWSTYRGFPSTIAFFQDRLIFANSPHEPQTAWMTRTSAYVDFARSSLLVDDDGITVTLNNRQVNPIKSIKSFLNSCVLFTDNSEWSVSSNTDGLVSPTTIQVKLQGNKGSSSVDPVVIGDRLIFIEPLGSTVRDMSYQYLANIFNSENISIYSEHLFQGHSIVAMAYQQEPDSILWMVRDDGILVSLTYLREQEMLGWAHHDTYDGEHLFESVCAIPGDNSTELWFVVKRGSNRYVERMILRTLSTDPADQFFVDCGSAYSGASIGSVSGYDRFDDLSVAVNAEGFVLDQQIVSGGEIDFDKARAKAQIGLPYKCDLETLDPALNLQDGPLQGRKYQINRAVFRFNDTIGGYVGADLDTLDSIAAYMRDESLNAAIPTPFFSDFVASPIRSSDSLRGHIAYRQLDPMPVTILSILSVIQPGNTP